MDNIKDVLHYHRDLTAEEIRDLVGDSAYIIEVGCNDGRDTKRFLEVMPQSHVICFDPEPRAAKHFRCRDNPRVTFIKVALWYKTEIVPFYPSGGIPDCAVPREEWFQSGSAKKPTGHRKRSPEITFSEPYDVQGHPLDFYWDEYQLPVDLLWCDTQGSEANIILGGQRTLLQTRYAIFEYYEEELYEGGANLRTLVSMLPGFDLIGIYGENALFRNRSL